MAARVSMCLRAASSGTVRQDRVLGPILQGTTHPVAYVPRGSSAEDIVDQVRLLISP